MWDRLDCDDLSEEEHRPAHNEWTWMLLRGAYIGSMSDEVEMKAYDENRLYGNGFRPGSVEVRVDDEKGRGVYAKELFKEGELVWEGLFTACFANGMAYRRFLRSIPHDLACDVFQWAYSGKEYGACVDLDEGSLINHAASKPENIRSWETGNKKPNIRSADSGMHTGETVAIRDIHPGEELLTDYGEFAEDSGWEHLGLGRWIVMHEIEDEETSEIR